MIMLLLLLLLLLISIWFHCDLYIALQCAFLWGPMGAKRRSLGTAMQPQLQEGFGNLRCSWTSLLQPGLCTGWARHGESRPGCRFTWAETWCLDSGRWAGHFGAVPISITWKDPVAFDTQYESFGYQGMLWSSQAPTQWGAKPICISQQCPDVQLMIAEGGSQPGDHTLCERQSNPSVVVILVRLKGCLMVIIGMLSKSWTSLTWCAPKDASC